MNPPGFGCFEPLFHRFPVQTPLAFDEPCLERSYHRSPHIQKKNKLTKELRSRVRRPVLLAVFAVFGVGCLLFGFSCWLCIKSGAFLLLACAGCGAGGVAFGCGLPTPLTAISRQVTGSWNQRTASDRTSRGSTDHSVGNIRDHLE